MEGSVTPMIAVVAGVLRQNGRLLISQRRPAQHQGMQWEFPGGKLEPGESPEQALERELKEEMDIETRAGGILAAIRHAFGERDLLILYYEATLVRGEPKALDANAIAFVTKEELAQYDLGVVDREFTARFL